MYICKSTLKTLNGSWSLYTQIWDQIPHSPAAPPRPEALLSFHGNENVEGVG